jgi:hypothetical protein
MRRLTYANVIATLALFVVLGGAGYAASQLKKNSVKSKQIKNGAVATEDLADGAVTTAKLGSGIDAGRLAPDSVKGAQIDESSLQGVNADKAGGMEVKRINFRVPYGTGFQTILVYPGIFRIDAQCQNSGDFIDVAAFTGTNGSAITETAIANTNGSVDTDGQRSIVSRELSDFDTNEAFEVDNNTELANSSAAKIHFATPDGFVATVLLDMSVPAAGCVIRGYSVGG